MANSESTKSRDVHRCCTCGQRVAEPVVRVDLDNNVLVAGVNSVRVSPTLAEFLHVLVRRFPNRVRRTEIMAALYGDSSAWPEDHIIAVWATKARRVLGAFGFTVENYRDGGYRLRRVELLGVNRAVTEEELIVRGST